ncbi:thiamine pyrophosphate-binding protein [Candidatus Berkelbacteria bacterium]|nr:thiamine pyrophosphate-binding protein [Candidatus Berkelbacteria bacterium]
MILSDYIMKRLVEYGVRHIFTVTGGGAMYLNDAMQKCKEIEYVCNHHEQACAMAAEGYSRACEKMAVVQVTTGPGGTNAITGVLGQWTDSVPVLYISGQVKLETSVESCPDIGLRQLGDQEARIVNIVKPITKFAAVVKDPKDVRKLLEKAIYICTHGRPGPVWLDIPTNVQGALIDETKLVGYDEKEDEMKFDAGILKESVKKVVELIKASKRPVIIAGRGIRISGSHDIFMEIAENLGIPVLSTHNGYDIIYTEHPLSVGRIGIYGDRPGNFALQNSDLLISIGSRNNVKQVSYNWKCFARAAKKVFVDIDKSELEKPTISPDIAIHSDARDFLLELKSQLEKEKMPSFSGWLMWCIERKRRYPVVLPEYKKPGKFVNPYYFNQKVTECLKEGDIIVTGVGTSFFAVYQSAIVKKNQRFIWNTGCSAMGYDLPAAIGACVASGKEKDIVCLAGDGSIQLNIQELQTISFHKMPVKIFVYNNNGYVSMRQTQENFFDKRYIGCDKDSGVGFPDIRKVASAYNIPSELIKSHEDMGGKIMKVLEHRGPIICEVIMDPNCRFLPKITSRKSGGKFVSSPLEDMFPFLEREELKDNMLIPMWEEGE